jgi:putative transposase
MRDLVILLVHVIATCARLLGPGGIRSVVAESVLLKQQLLILNRSRQRSPNLRSSERLVAVLCALLIHPARLIRSAIVLKPSTLLKLHQTLKNRKYRLLFSSERKGRPGPKGPSKELIEAVVQTKQRNPSWGCPRIALQIALAFAIQIDKDVVRRILATHYRPELDTSGPSWLTFIGHLKDSLWSIDLFRCESARLRTHWILVVMDQYTRRIIGFGVQVGTVDGMALCRMFNRAIHDAEVPELRPRSALSIRPVASQSANSGGGRDQNGTLPSAVSSIRGTADWDDSKRVFGSHLILDDRRSRKQAAGVPGLLQHSSYPSVTERTNTRSG